MDFLLHDREPYTTTFSIQSCSLLNTVDINSGCPIDLIYKRGMGCGLMGRKKPLEVLCRAMSSVLSVPLTVKMRTGIYMDKKIAHTLIPSVKEWGVDMITLHGRSREQRYYRLADWDYIGECAKVADPVPLFGNGDIINFEDYYSHKESAGVSGIMFARGALIKPWVFTEVKERRHWDISASERLDMIRSYAEYGLDHWGSDSKGVETTRRFLLEWLSFLHRYVPHGILERPPQRMNERIPRFVGRNELETLLASPSCADWVRISGKLRLEKNCFGMTEQPEMCMIFRRDVPGQGPRRFRLRAQAQGARLQVTRRVRRCSKSI